ncbi:hypothetical protein B0G82_4222 [Paraburkholderia sp. BL17N1]|nr:hypothetical protein B0G82_4222 [Paraburkholderia sp. BL17N1]
MTNKRNAYRNPFDIGQLLREWSIHRLFNRCLSASG